MDPSITYFPVGNGDSILIELADGSTVMIDCNITEESRDEDEQGRYDVHAHLLKVFRKDASGRHHVDSFILSHPDKDHCTGFTKTFYTGDPTKYSDADKKSGLIIIDELWFTPRIFSLHEGKLCEEAKAFRREARRRMKLHREAASERNDPGNRLRIIGFSDNPDLDGLEDLISVPGSSVNVVNGEDKEDFSFFVHAPFKREVDSEDEEGRNDASVVLRAEFAVDGAPRAGLAFFGGDAGCGIWEEILDKSEDDTLDWDLFLAAHHCSWSFFSDEPYDENQEPSEKCIEVLNKKRPGAIVVASCKPIKDDDDNPPHYAAAEEYKTVVGKDNFYVTGEHPDEKRPLPIRFEISRNGPVKVESKTAGSVASSAAAQAAVGTPQTYG